MRWALPNGDLGVEISDGNVGIYHEKNSGAPDRRGTGHDDPTGHLRHESW